MPTLGGNASIQLFYIHAESCESLHVPDTAEPNLMIHAFTAGSVSSRHPVNVRATIAAVQQHIVRDDAEIRATTTPEAAREAGNSSHFYFHPLAPGEPLFPACSRCGSVTEIQREIQYAFPRAETGQSVSTLPFRTPTYQSWRLQVGSQWPGTRRSRSLMLSRFCGSRMIPCSSELLT